MDRGLLGSGRVLLVPQPLIAYRQHGRQSTGPPRGTSYLSFLIRLLADRKKRARSPLFAAVAERLESLTTVDQSVNPTIRHAMLRHWRARSGLPARRLARLPVVMRELLTLRYHRFSSGLLTAAKDLLFVE